MLHLEEKDQWQNEAERKDASEIELRMILWEIVVGEEKDQR
jgi:hypothetical protein